MLDEIHARKLRPLEDLGLPEVIIVIEPGTVPAPTLQGLKNEEIASDVLPNEVKREQGMPQMIKHTEKQNEVERLPKASNIIDRELPKFHLHTKRFGNETALSEIAFVRIDSENT